MGMRGTAHGQRPDLSINLTHISLRASLEGFGGKDVVTRRVRESLEDIEGFICEHIFFLRYTTESD